MVLRVRRHPVAPVVAERLELHQVQADPLRVLVEVAVVQAALRSWGLGKTLPIRFAPLVTVVVTAVPHDYGFLEGSQNAVSAHARRVSGSVPGGIGKTSCVFRTTDTRHYDK